MPPNTSEAAFDVIPFSDIEGDWKKLGSGSFGNVYKGSYLGIDVAIKEVLPSNDYDVAKYFEREWRLMKEARHPNVVLYLGLSRAPPPDNRIFIISEFISNGNLRQYIYDKSKPFPWKLRMSFATDITRALAYLHARKCIHRDLKGENLLVTENGRLKITDFGFARIAARNAEESKRLTFCGTDSYMSPEILIGNEFDLPTDIFSLGVIFCEIAARRLADDNHFKRSAPFWDMDEEEVRNSASPGCPPEFVQLALDCVKTDPAVRPTTREILTRLHDIESEVLLRAPEEDLHLGSIKLMSQSRRPGAAPRIPSFGMGVAKDIANKENKSSQNLAKVFESSSDDETSDDELIQAVTKLSTVRLNSTLTRATTGHSGESTQPLVGSDSALSLDSSYSDYSTTVIRGHTPNGNNSNAQAPPSLSSVLTVRPSPVQPQAEYSFALPEPRGTASMMTIDSFRTASSGFSSAKATEGGSTMRSLGAPLVHRFTLLKPGGAKRAARSAIDKGQLEAPPVGGGWNPLEYFLTSGLLVAKCDVCTKRLGWKPILECDDCGLKAHVRCGEVAPKDCGLRPARPRAHEHGSQTPPQAKAKVGAKAI